MSESGPLRLTVEWEREEERRQWEKAVKQPRTEEAAYLLSILSAREAAFQILEGGGALQENEEDSSPSRSGLADRIVQFLKLLDRFRNVWTTRKSWKRQR